MSDRYSQLVNAPLVSTIAKQLGLPQPVDARPLQAGRAGRLRPGPLRRRARRPPRASTLAAVLDQIKAERAGAEGKAKALVFDATGIADSTELVELQRFFYPAVGRLQRSGRVVVLGTPPARGRLGPRPHRPAGAGGLHPLARQGDRRPRLDRAARLRRARRRGPARLDPALPALAALGLRLRPGGPGRQRRRADPRDRLGAPARRQGRRSSPAPRAGSAPRSPRPWPATAPSVVGLDVPQARRRPARGHRARSAARRSALDITAEDAPGADRRALRRRASTSSSTTPASPRDRTIAKMPDERWAQLMEINLSSEERINDALLDGKRAGRRTAASSASPRCPGSPATPARPTTPTSKAGVIGMVEAMAPELAERGATINAVAPGFIETKMTAAMPIGPREAGRRLSSLSPGRPAGRRRRDDRLVRQPRLDRRQRQRRPRLRPEPAGGLRWRPGPSTARPSILPLYARAAAAPMIPGASLLPFVPGGGGEIPETSSSSWPASAPTRATSPPTPRSAASPCATTLPADLPARARLPAAHGGDGATAASRSARSASSTSRTGSSSTGRSGSARS